MSAIDIQYPTENSMIIQLDTDKLANFFKKNKSTAIFDMCGYCGDKGHSTELHGVFRTKMCSHFQQGGCKFPHDCSFAHSDHELRIPWV